MAAPHKVARKTSSPKKALAVAEDGRLVSELTVEEKVALNAGKMGRPYAVLDEKQIEALAAMGASVTTIANFFGVDPQTIMYSYSQSFQRGRENLNLRLQVAQVERALNGSDTMLIHLGKARLGQSDKVEVAAAPTHMNANLQHIPDDKLNDLLYEITTTDGQGDS